MSRILKLVVLRKLCNEFSEKKRNFCEVVDSSLRIEFESIKSYDIDSGHNFTLDMQCEKKTSPQTPAGHSSGRTGL